MIEAVFLDVDGTLLNNQHEIPTENLNAIKEAKTKGIFVCIATGRSPQDLKRYYEELMLDTPAICMNGAYIYDFKKNKIIKEEKISIPPIKKLKELVEKTNLENSLEENYAKKLSIVYYEGPRWFTNCETSAVETEENTVGHGIEIIDFEEMIEMWKKENRNPNKIGVLCNDEEILMKAYEPLKKEFKDHLNIHKSQKNFLEVIPPSVSKGNAIKFIIENYFPHIKRENIMAVGDSDNDISMLSWAGLGIAMGNAATHIKEIAKESTLTNEESGVAKAIKKHILNHL